MINGMPRFELREIDGRPVVVDGRVPDEGVQIRIEGHGAAAAYRYLLHVNYYALIALLGLLEDARGTRAYNRAVHFLSALRLDEPLGVDQS